MIKNKMPISLNKIFGFQDQEHLEKSFDITYY